MSYTFKYITMERQGFAPAKAPYLPVILHGAEGRIFNVAALVDSGADTCAMPKSVAEMLGLDLENAQESNVGTASGFVSAKRADVRITVNLVHERRTILAPFNVMMGEY